VRNIAEGAGPWSQADSANRYKIARGAAMECAASLEVMRLRKLIADARYERGIHDQVNLERRVRRSCSRQSYKSPALATKM
jgi:four helix bundle protein